MYDGWEKTYEYYKDMIYRSFRKGLLEESKRMARNIMNCLTNTGSEDMSAWH
jgi:hypothetical protein